MDNTENELWDIVCSKRQFDKLKSDERFLALLRLARFVNALMFCHRPVINAGNMDTPDATRQRINSFVFASSVLYEGFRVAEQLGKHFRQLDSFKNGFANLMRDRNAQNLKNTILKRMRDKFVFHFDKDVATEALEGFELPHYKFATGKGKVFGQMYFCLADEVVMNFLLQLKDEESDDELKLRFQNITQDITQLMVKFLEAAEKLIAEALIQMGWVLRDSSLREGLL